MTKRSAPLREYLPEMKEKDGHLVLTLTQSDSVDFYDLEFTFHSHITLTITYGSKGGPSEVPILLQE